MIRNKRYEANKKNDGIIPVVLDTRALYVPRKCDNCIECRKQKAREWMVRLQEDIKTNKGAKFITLTFSNEGLQEIVHHIMKEKPENWEMTGYEMDNAIATKAMRLFNERYRKQHKKALRHWMITELGHEGTENIHMHGIAWPQCDLDQLEKIWKYGWMWKYKMVKEEKINYVNNRTINYITKYVTKIDELYKNYKAIILSSPGIGKNYTDTFAAERNKYNGEKTRNYYRTENGYKIALPKYWRNKIYNDEEREAIWMETLDKGEIYICGEKINITKTMERAFETRKYYRKENRRLGYGSYHKDENRIEWEEKRRAKKFMQRIERANTDFWWMKE